MAKYLWHVSYTTDGIKGVLKEGGSSRAKSIGKLVESHGGKLEAFYFAFGDADCYLIAELPGNLEASAISLAVSASGAARVKTTVLLSPKEIDAAGKVKVAYRAPGA